jgi:hypothetical protein
LQEVYYSTFAHWLKATCKAFSHEAAAGWQKIGLNHRCLRPGLADFGRLTEHEEFDPSAPLAMTAADLAGRGVERGKKRRRAAPPIIVPLASEHGRVAGRARFSYAAHSALNRDSILHR